MKTFPGGPVIVKCSFHKIYFLQSGVKEMF